MATDPWLIVTPEQYKRGWIEMRGTIPVHHEYLWVRDIDPEHIVVRNPQWVVEQRPLEMRAWDRS
jgi:hypothetical protein